MHTSLIGGSITSEGHKRKMGSQDAYKIGAVKRIFVEMVNENTSMKQQHNF